MDPLHHMSTNNKPWKNNMKTCFTCTCYLIKAAQITFEIYSQVVQEHSLNHFKTRKISKSLTLVTQSVPTEVEIRPL
jgi:hypothetical protein